MRKKFIVIFKRKEDTSFLIVLRIFYECNIVWGFSSLCDEIFTCSFEELW